MDYASITSNLGPIGYPGITIIVTIDTYSNVYWGLGLNVGKSYATGWSASISGGWLGGNPLDGVTPPEFELESFLTGFAINASGGAGPGIGITWIPFPNGSYQIASETGFYTPQYGIAIYYSWLFFDN